MNFTVLITPQLLTNHYLLLGNLYICRPLSSITRQICKISNFSSHLRIHLQQSISKYLVFFISENTSSNKSYQSKSISYHQGRKQGYLISCFFPTLFFVFVLTYRTRRKRAISRHMESSFRSGTDSTLR